MSTEKKLRIAVIGGGPGGYVAAIRAAQLGAEVVLIEKNKLGGTCLNVGCIPTKALLHSAQLAGSVQDAQRCGVDLTVTGIDWQKVMGFKQKVIDRLVSGVSGLMRANKIRVINGTAGFENRTTLKVQTSNGSETVTADRIIIAAGSQTFIPDIPGIKESRFVMDSTKMLECDHIPASMIIIGGGVIGLEFGCAFQAFGTKVTIVEALDRICAAMDGDISEALTKELETRGIEILTSCKVTQVADGESTVTITVERQEGTVEKLTAETALAALGRRPCLESLNLEKAEVATRNGKIEVNERMETSTPGIYAIGDCVGQIMLAHTASAQGETAAENAMGGSKLYSPASVPSCIYCFPEAASAGMTEEQVKEQNIPYHVGKFPLSANGRALILDGGVGMVKVIVGDELGEVLGVHIIGSGASELISEANLLITMEGTCEEDILSIHAHPSISEAVREAFLAAEKRAIHMTNKR